MRTLRLSLVAVVCLSTLAAADLKIKTRTTVMGHTTESTVYIKGARQRTEMSFGGRGGTASIMQCDQKRMITVMGDQCMLMPFGESETSCPDMPNMRDMLRGKQPAPARAGGVVTITRNSTDTGERQDMFGYKARHIKSTMIMQASPDACNQSNMKMEMDGWYADLSTAFSCGDDSYRAMACGGQQEAGCHDRVVMKGGGGAPLGYPLKQTMTMTSKEQTYTMTTEVVELTNTSLEPTLFEAPPGCRMMDMTAMMGGTTHSPAAEEMPVPAPAPAATPAATAAPATQPAPAPTVAPKAAGVVRVGVVKINDQSGQSLPTNNLRLNLMSEFGRAQLEVVPLETESPQQDVESEAHGKQCDYYVYTVPTVVKDAGSGGIPPSSLPKGVTLDPAKYQALTLITLYRVGKPAPELKNIPLAADDNGLAVNAVMETFVQEADAVAKQIADDGHPKPAAKAPPAKRPTAAKPKQN
jgi:hypothetical protein